MTSRRKRLKKLMQSIGIQRNDFKRKLKNIREIDQWSYQDILKWIERKRICDSLANSRISDIMPQLIRRGIKISDGDGYKTTEQIINEIFEKMYLN